MTALSLTRFILPETQRRFREFTAATRAVLKLHRPKAILSRPHVHVHNITGDGAVPPAPYNGDWSYMPSIRISELDHLTIEARVIGLRVARMTATKLVQLQRSSGPQIPTSWQARYFVEILRPSAHVHPLAIPYKTS